MSLKAQFSSDLDVFFNSDEFAVQAIFKESGFKSEITVLIDEVLGENGITVSTIITAKTFDVEKISKQSRLEVEGKIFGPISWSNVDGTTEIFVQELL